jgi:hypothetical protein
MNINITYNHGLQWYIANIDDGEHDYSISAPTKTELINKIKNEIL